MTPSRIYESPYPPLDPRSFSTNILDFIFPPNSPSPPSDQPLWISVHNPDQSLSKAQALRLIRRVGAGLDHLGIPKGGVIFVHTPNHIYVPALYLGVVGSGRIFSGASSGASADELSHQLRDNDAVLVLSHPSVVKTAVEAVTNLGWGESRVVLFGEEALQESENRHEENGNSSPGVSGLRDWRHVLLADEEVGERWKWNHMDKDNEAAGTIATINYSSGTTGLPKGVCVSHSSIIANAMQVVISRDARQEYSPSSRPAERWIGFLPLYHAFGQQYACILAAHLQFPIYIMKSFDLPIYLSTIATHRITHLQVVPPILVMLTKRPEPALHDLSSLRAIICGAAPLAKELQNEVMGRFKVNVTQGWGMTEVTCGGLVVPGGARDLTGSVGLLTPSTKGRLVGEDGKDVGEGEEGELYIKGPQLCLGYWRNEKATKETFDAEGYLQTGDVAVVNKDGWFTIVDRKKELIKVNALQVAPAELKPSCYKTLTSPTPP